MVRRSFLRQLAALPFIAAASPNAPAADTGKLKILMKSAWGSDDPTKAASPFFTPMRFQKLGTMFRFFCWAKRYR
jgi:hypothetical protein